MTTLLTDMNEGATIRASSILQKKAKLYGPKNALDYENTSSSWNSEGIVNGSSNNDDENDELQYLIIGFSSDRQVLPKSIKIQFQAGFGCEQCHIYGTMGKSNNNSVDNNNNIGGGDDEWIKICSLELMDVHDLQTHELTFPTNEHNNIQQQYYTAVKIVFDDFADFYKRIIVYRIEIWGDVVLQYHLKRNTFVSYTSISKYS